MRARLLIAGLLTILMQGTLANAAEEFKPEYVRIASGVSGHIHPAACVTQKGTVLVIFGQRDRYDLKIARSTDGGRTWSEPEPFPLTVGTELYPGALKTLADGRVMHIWNEYYPDADGRQGKSRYARFALSEDEGKTWGKIFSLPKNPDAESVVRHPIVELGPDRWLFPLWDQTVVYQPSSGKVTPFGDGRNHGLTQMVQTPKGTLITGYGLRSTDEGQNWTKIEPFPKVGDNGWRFDMMVADNGWIVTAEVEGPGVGGNSWRYVVSRDDGLTWDFKNAVVFYNPGRPIGGRACPKTVQLDEQTLGTVFYDTDASQPGGSGVFFLRTPLSALDK